MNRLRLNLSAMLILSITTSCAVPDGTRFYILADSKAKENQPEDVDAPSESVPIGLRISGFPRYLDRPQIVTRDTRNQLRIAEFDRWAEPLDTGFTRQLMQQLQTYAGRPVKALPWRGDTKPKPIVDVDVHHFEKQADGNVWLDATWQLYDTVGQTITSPEHTRIVIKSEPLSSYNTLARIMSRTISNLAKQITEEIKSIE